MNLICRNGHQKTEDTMSSYQLVRGRKYGKMRRYFQKSMKNNIIFFSYLFTLRRKFWTCLSIDAVVVVPRLKVHCIAQTVNNATKHFRSNINRYKSQIR